MKRAPITVATDPTRSLELERFLPHRLAVVADSVSAAMATECSARFGLSVAEWRIITVLAHSPGLSAAQLALRTTLDKVATSRAVASLVRARRVERSIEESDRRRSHLRLTPGGIALFNELAPLALDYEDAVLRTLPTRLRRDLGNILDALQRRATSIRIHRPGPEHKAPTARAPRHTGN